MTVRSFMVSAALLCCAAAAGTADPGQPGAHFIENWDANADGRVTRTEAAEKRADLFYMFDQDEDGLLSPAEYDLFDATRAADMQANAGGGRGPLKTVHEGLMRAFNDSDGNGSVSREEFLARSDAWFDLVDRDGDGAITGADFGARGN